MRIPDRHHLGLGRIRTLSDDAVSELVAALRDAAATVRYEHILAAVEPKIQSVSLEDLKEVLQTLIALYLVRAQADVSVQRFTADLITAMQQSGTSALQVSQEDRPRVEKRLTELLDIDPLSTASKATDLLADHARTFCNGRILTDLRPVFRVDPSKPPVGFVVQHTLKLEYHVRGGHEEFYVALDSRDISALRDVVDRAEAKAKSLRALLKQANLTEIETDIGE